MTGSRFLAIGWLPCPPPVLNEGPAGLSSVARLRFPAELILQLGCLLFNGLKKGRSPHDTHILDVSIILLSGKELRSYSHTHSTFFPATLGERRRNRPRRSRKPLRFN